MIATHAYSCQQCGSKATWHPGRQQMVCGSCDASLDLPAPPSGEIPWLPLVERLRDSPDNRHTWTPSAVTTPCVACGGPVTFPVNHASTVCAGCGTPLVRGAAPGDPPLAPGGVIPFTFGEGRAEDLLRRWAADRDGGRLGDDEVDVQEVRREYVPYWEFSAHIHCPYRGAYQYTDRQGQVQQRVYGGTIDETLKAFGRGFSHLPAPLLDRIGSVSFEPARPYDPRYLAGAVVQQDTRSLWAAWDMARHSMDTALDDTLKAAGDGETLPPDAWPTWSRHQGRSVLVPLYVFTCRAVEEQWTGLVHGMDESVVGDPPMTRRTRARLMLMCLGAAAVVVYLIWRAGSYVVEHPSEVLRAIFY